MHVAPEDSQLCSFCLLIKTTERVVTMAFDTVRGRIALEKS